MIFAWSYKLWVALSSVERYGKKYGVTHFTAFACSRFTGAQLRSFHFMLSGGRVTADEDAKNKLSKSFYTRALFVVFVCRHRCGICTTQNAQGKICRCIASHQPHIHNSFVVVVRWVAHFSGLLQGWWLLELNNNAICGGNYCVLKSFGISVRTTIQTAIEWLRTALCCVRLDSQFSIKFSWAKLFFTFLFCFYATLPSSTLQVVWFPVLYSIHCMTNEVEAQNKKQWMAIGKRKDSCGSRLLAKDADADAFHRWLAMHSPLRSNIVAVRTNNKNNALLCLRRIYLQPKRDEENEKKKITNCNVMECTLLSSAHSGLDRSHFVALRSGHDESCKCRRMQYFSIFIPE